MSQSSAHPGGPVDRIWTEALRAFARPVAVLARPRPEWRRFVGQQEVDGLLQQIELGYCDGHTMLVQVITNRRLPEHVRVFAPLGPEGALINFLYSDSPDPPIRLSDMLPPEAGQLVVDGAAVEAQLFRYGDHMCSLASIGEETVAVVSTAALHGQAVHLTLDTTAVPT
jgi:hypothetical protein